jgi:hypothetical protein
LRSQDQQEYQLFWLAHILEAYLLKTKKASAVINALYSNPRATPISKAKVLEIADNRYGLPELREPPLRSGQSDWLSWSTSNNRAADDCLFYLFSGDAQENAKVFLRPG